MGLEMCLSLFSFVPFSYVHCQFSMVFKVIRQCLSFGYQREIKTDWNLRRKSVAGVCKGTFFFFFKVLTLLPWPSFAPLKTGSCTASASPSHTGGKHPVPQKCYNIAYLEYDSESGFPLSIVC